MLHFVLFLFNFVVFILFVCLFVLSPEVPSNGVIFHCVATSHASAVTSHQSGVTEDAFGESLAERRPSLSFSVMQLKE